MHFSLFFFFNSLLVSAEEDSGAWYCWKFRTDDAREEERMA